MYKFQRVNEGPLRGCYHHPNFSRDRFDLIDKINRKDRGDEDGSSAGCLPSPFTSRLRKKTGKLSIRKSIEELLSASDSDTAISDDNDVESIDRASMNSEKGEGSERPNCKNNNVPLNGSVSNATCSSFEASSRMGDQSGLFDMRGDFSLKSDLTSLSLFPSTLFLEPLNFAVDPFCGVEKAVPLSSSSLELSIPFVSSPPTDILEEIIRTFSILPSDL